MEVYRFVILLHKSPADEHWDVMLEIDSALSTWSIPPQNLTGLPFVCSARLLPDHRKYYLDYEGTVSGNRGTVSRIDYGTYNRLPSGQYILSGKIFSGILTIEATTMIFSRVPSGEY